MADDAARIAQLEAELRQARDEVTEAREQQTATAEILRVIASSPTDLDTVLDAIVTSAARLCDADSVGIHRVEGDLVRNVAHTDRDIIGKAMPFDRSSVTAEVILDRRTMHTHETEADLRARYPGSRLHEFGYRVQAVTPLRLGDEAIGT